MGVLAIPSVCLCYLLPRNLELNFENIMKIISIALALSIFLISIYNFDQNFSKLTKSLSSSKTWYSKLRRRMYVTNTKHSNSNACYVLCAC